jgi:chaperonin GroES
VSCFWAGCRERLTGSRGSIPLGTEIAKSGRAKAQFDSTTNSKNMSVTIRPLADRVLVEPAAAEEKTASGIIIPDSAKEKPQRGTVVAVGPGKKDEPTTVQVGDTVLYGKYSGTELQHDGKDYMIMRESDILAVL